VPELLFTEARKGGSRYRKIPYCCVLVGSQQNVTGATDTFADDAIV
jgi:hypothetical protein